MSANTEFNSTQSDFDDSDDDECPIAETFSGEFLFDPQSDDPSNKYTQKCCMKVKVIEKIYSHEKGSPHWYYITYSYELVGAKSGKRKTIDEGCYRHPSHPWWGRHNAEDEYLGTIICKNEMTEKMIKYLVMPMNELETLCAPRCPQQYKRQVLHSIAMFW